MESEREDLKNKSVYTTSATAWHTSASSYCLRLYGVCQEHPQPIPMLKQILSLMPLISRHTLDHPGIHNLTERKAGF